MAENGMVENKLSVGGTICTGLVTQCNATGVTHNSHPPGVGLEFSVSGTAKPMQLAICWKTDDDNGDQCPICWETITDHKTTECNHTMCTKCLDKWLEETNSCPICRKKIQNHTHTLNDLSQIQIPVFASTYNVFRIMSGLGGLSYSS
jgi:hypothetical protein